MFECRVRGLAKEVTDSIGGSKKREVGFSREKSGQTQDSSKDDEAHRGAVSFAGTKNALDAEGGMSTFKTPNDREKHGQKMGVRGEKGKDEFANKAVAKRREDFKGLRVGRTESSEVRVFEGPRLPVQGPSIIVLHGSTAGARKAELLMEVGEGFEFISKGGNGAIKKFGEKALDRGREKGGQDAKQMEEGGQIEHALVNAIVVKGGVNKWPPQCFGSAVKGEASQFLE